MTTDDRGERPAADKNALQHAVDESTAVTQAAAGEPIVNAGPPAGKKAAAKRAPAAKKAAAAKKTTAKKATTKKAPAKKR